MSAPSASAQTPILLQLWDFIWNSIVRVLWLCGYATVTAVGTAYLFIGNDQGRDLLRLAAEHPWSRANLIFLIGAALLGLTLWYTSRLLLRRDFPRYPFPARGSATGRTWIPRVFGASVPASIGIGFFLVTTSAQFTAWILGAIFLLLALILFWLVTRRRRMLGLDPELGLARAAQTLGSGNWIALTSAFVLSLLLLAGFLVWPVELPRLLGTPAIVMTGLAGIALFGGLVLTYAFLANGQPNGTAFVLVLALIFGLFNDNHWIRLTDRTSSITQQPAQTRLQSWRAAHEVTSAGTREPLILVAASGGGIRAAYWTASSLARLESIPRFADHLFAISGVSGGSVGAAVYAALERQRLDAAYAANPSSAHCSAGVDPTTLGQVREALGKDFLSPVVAGLLFPDLIQRFLPFPVAAADRQRFLELGFERSLGDPPNPLSGAFLDLYADRQGDCLPSLLLNTTSVESGQRAILSNLQVGRFTDTLDLLAPPFALQRIRLSSAAGASARFTYVSPAGTLQATTADGPLEKRVVDGGYFENSGAASTIDLLRLLMTSDSQKGGAIAQSVYPVLLLVRNDPQAPPVCHRTTQQPQSQADTKNMPRADELMSEVAAPLRALLQARSARGRLAEVDAAKEIEAMGGAVIELQLEVVPAPGKERLTHAQLTEAPLGWSLSQEVRAGMDRALDEPPARIAGEMKLLSHVLDGQTGLYVPCNAY